jgi:hypothetical protein
MKRTTITMRVTSDTKGALLAFKRTHSRLKWDDIIKLYALELPENAIIMQSAKKNQVIVNKIRHIMSTNDNNSAINPINQDNERKMTTALLVIPN